jgi:hypothetical protein
MMDNHRRTIEQDLTSTVPRADPQFQDQLEAAFLDRIRQERQQMLITAQQKRGLASLRFSLTAFAAVIALVIVGIAAFYASQPEPEPGAPVVAFQATGTLLPQQMTATMIVYNATGTALAAQGQPVWTATTSPSSTNTLSPTPTDTPTMTPSAAPNNIWPSDTFVPATIPELSLVYVAARDIANGEIVIEADFIPTYWPSNMVPGDPMGLIFSGETAFATRDIAQWQPILSGDLSILSQ